MARDTDGLQVCSPSDLARYATPERYFGDSFRQQVYQREPEQSKERILKHLENLLQEVEKEKLLRIVG